MNRTYHFQVDNGLFVAEYYAKKPYSELTTEDIKKLAHKLGDIIGEYNSIERPSVKKGSKSTIAQMTHHNSILTQGGAKVEKGEVEKYIVEKLFSHLGNDIECAVCGEKRIGLHKTEGDLPNTSLLYGTSSNDNFRNSGNNLNYKIVCPVCLTLSLFSILNTQRRGNAILYLTDSDDLMRHYTKDFQVNIELALDGKCQSQMDVGDNINLLHNTLLMEDIFDDVTYIDIYDYSLNARSPSLKIKSIEYEVIKLINNIRRIGLYDNFIEMGLQDTIVDDRNPLRIIYKNIDKIDVKLYEMLKEAYMTRQDIELLKIIVDRILDNENKDKILKEISNNSNAKQALKNIFIKYITLDNITDTNYVLKSAYQFRDYILMEVKIREENKNE